MDVDPNDFRQHYGALSDEALLRLNPDDLTDVARQCYQVELFHRGLKRAVPPKLVERGTDEVPLASLGPRYSAEDLPWDVVVTRWMVPDHQAITDFEVSLEKHAFDLGGRNEGWGCFTEPST